MLLTQNDGGCYNPEFSPDGKTIYFLVGESSGEYKRSLWRVNLDGSHLQKLTGPQLFDDPLKPLAAYVH